MAMDPYKVFQRPLMTEKSTIQKDKYRERLGAESYVKYTLEVDMRATKQDIRRAIETLFPETEGQIIKINTMRKQGKRRDSGRLSRFRRFRPGRSAGQKKAIVTLRGNVTITQFEGA
ncbi:MAG: 50S ribosomal protein L23 [Candidatus Poribacteria bacterium]|nr:50S ribosomal protein L23 [Candidatus Poribacteria bacterium]